MTFDDTHTEAVQEFELHRDPTGLLEYPTKYGGGHNRFYDL
jgi:hypothetical protein